MVSGSKVISSDLTYKLGQCDIFYKNKLSLSNQKHKTIHIHDIKYDINEKHGC